MPTLPHLAAVAVAIDHNSVDLSLRRAGAGTYVKGKWVEGEPTTFTIRGAVFATNPTQIRDLPEGVVKEARYTIWTRHELKTVAPDVKRSGDQIQWIGEWYDVIYVWERREAGFTKALLGVSNERGRTI